MNDQEQNIAIAEACGWKRMESPPKMWFFYPDNGKTFPKGAHAVYELPNYVGSLDAMAQAEKVLPNEQTKRLYVDHLVCLMKPGEFTVMAPSRQRAEAFLKTLNLWKDNQ